MGDRNSGEPFGQALIADRARQRFGQQACETFALGYSACLQQYFLQLQSLSRLRFSRGKGAGMTIYESTTRRGGREARRSLRTAPKLEMLPTLRRALPVVEPMDADQVARV